MKKASYKKLWKLLIDKDLNKKTLAQMANVGASTITKLVKGESVSMEILVKICNSIDCDLSDIVELVEDTEGQSSNL